MAERRPWPELPQELVAEILARLPPREPACLLRASLACKTWGHAISYPGFRGRLRDFHRAPPVLGFLHNWEDERVPRFIRTTTSSFSLAAPDCRSWRALDFRHGRALFLSKGQNAGKELLLWDPITGVQQNVRVPVAFARDYEGAEKLSPTAAVICAGGGCDHRDCHERPFRLVFVFSVEVGTAYDTSALVYSSETGQWGEPTSMQGVLSMMQGVLSMEFTCYSSVLLVKKSLLYFMTDNWLILEYDLERHNLAVLHPPDQSGYVGRFNILAEDGELRFCQYMYPKLKMWKREASDDDTDAQWVLSRAIYLECLLPIGDLLAADTTVQVMGFAEEADVVFLNTNTGIFTVELQSRQARKVFENYGFCNVIPIVSFYTPVPRGGEHQGGLVNSSECISHCFENRVLSYGEVASECAGMEDTHGHTLSSEAQEVTDPLGDVPNSAPNEELVKTTSVTSKDDAGNSKTSCSNVEDAAPTSEKGDC